VGPRIEETMLDENRLDRGRDLITGETILKVVRSSEKSLGVPAAVYAAKGIIQSTITARCVMRSFVTVLTTCWSKIT